MPVTEHPQDTTSGISDLPPSPDLKNRPSSKNATRAIYPLSSKSVISRNNTKICGKNAVTVPSPPNTALSTSDISHSGAPTEKSVVAVFSPNEPKNRCINPPRKRPVFIDRKYTAVIIATNIATPEKPLKRTLSAFNVNFSALVLFLIRTPDNVFSIKE